MVGLSSTWESLAPKTRRALTLAAGALLIAALALLMATAPNERDDGAEQRRRLVSNLLTDVDPRALGIDGLGRRLNALEGEVRRLTADLEQVGLSSEDNDAQIKLVETLRREREQDLSQLRAEVTALRADHPIPDDHTTPKPAPTAVQAPPNSAEPPTQRTPPMRPEPPALNQLFDPPFTRNSEQAPSANKPESAARALSIRHVRDEHAAAEQTAEQAAADAIPDVRIPAGSILRGVFLSGMDAPTGRAARQDPYPALLRLKHAAILPNRFRADIRECFLLVGGYGDLGSERVYLRAESINCVRTDGRTLEVAVDGYAVGEDGKVGVRGRLVNKQGQVIGRAMQVSFLQGFSRLFSTVPVAAVATGGTTVPYQQVLSGESLQGAAIAGTGKALDRLAEYYLDLAENIFPVLEVDAGRGVEVILNRGVGLKIQ